MLARWVAIVALTACVDSSSVRCPDGSICPDGTQCATVDEETLCVLPDQIARCAGKLELDECGTNQRCYDGVCLTAGCGNGRVDPGEACDDKNTVPNDGCSADCRSDETCGNGVVDFVKAEQCDDGPAASALSHDGCASDCTVENAVWQTVPPLALIDQGAIAYDPKRDRLVLFGDVQSVSQTWEWDGARWQLRLPRVSPVPRVQMAMAYDPVNEVVLMFGGRSTNDTWSWDGTTWKLLAPAMSPPARSQHAMVSDPRGKRIVMYGGQSPGSTTLGDTWVWDGTTWAPLAGGPPARRGPAMAYDPSRNVVVLFGGQFDATTNDDQTWELAGQAWTRRMPATVPPPRVSAGMAWDPRGKQIVMHGGSGGGVRTDTWLWNGTDWTLHPIAGPGLSIGFTMTTAAREGTAIALDRGRTFRWNAGWTPVEDGTALVPPRFSAAAAVDIAGRRVLIHGGLENNVVTQVSVLWTGTWQRQTNTAAGSSPGRLSNAALAFDTARRQFVHFGGLDAVSGLETNQTWVYDTAWSQKTPAAPLPAPRFGHVLVNDAARGRVVLFGGFTHDDTWLWDGAAWAQATPAMKPSARGLAAAAYDPIRRVVVLFGGASGGLPLGDTWEWDGTTWNPRTVPGPPPRSDAGMAWDAARKRVVLFGGAGQTSSLNDQWEWDGQAWTQIPTLNTVKPRASHVLVSALGEGGVLAFGGIGESGNQFTDLLWLHWDNDAVEELCRAADVDGDALAGCADADCWRVCTPECEPGATCASTRGCGDGTCDPITESCTSCAMDCTCGTFCGNSICEPGETNCPGDCP